jgi:hypothetical protein
MVNGESPQSAVATPQSEDSAALEQTAADVISTTFVNWMLRTYVATPSVSAGISKARGSTRVRSASFNSLA